MNREENPSIINPPGPPGIKHGIKKTKQSMEKYPDAPCVEYLPTFGLR